MGECVRNVGVRAFGWKGKKRLEQLMLVVALSAKGQGVHCSLNVDGCWSVLKDLGCPPEHGLCNHEGVLGSIVHLAPLTVVGFF